ncbi:MAG: hypothetical protein V5A64_00615 [Candidatus Thermoplasmatota archaeon]
MIDILKDILPYISGLYTLPWILIGFIVTIIIAQFTGREKIDKIMKKIGLIILYFFVPLLLFRIFLNTPFGSSEIEFAAIVCGIIALMYLTAFLYARYQAKKQKLSKKKRNLYIKTVLTNQGRSSAFIGGAMLAINAWAVPAAIFMAPVGIALFAIIPYLLSHLHKKEAKKENTEIEALPWFLKIYPWYLITFVIAAIIINQTTNITTASFGNIGTILKFYTAITIPAALYYVGAGIHPTDLKKSEMKKLLGLDKEKEDSDHWKWVRNIFVLTVFITPILIAAIFTPLLLLNLIPKAWYPVIIINAILPVTSTNMFLLPYGIDKKTTAHIITWTTLVCVPIVVALIAVFGIYFT